MGTVYKPLEAIRLLRCSSGMPITRPPGFLPSRSRLPHLRTAATSSTNPPHPSQPQRRSVTITNDTGAVRWTDLSPGEKAARTVQQSFNLGIVLVGIALTGTVGYFLYADVLSPSSKTSHFNRAVSHVRSSPQIQSLLGPGAQIAAHGEASWSRWARNRYISSSSETDKWGTEHTRIRFYIEGPKGQGTVHAHLTRRPGQEDWEYHTLAVDVKGHGRIYLEDRDAKKGTSGPRMFGARWW